MPAHQSAWPPYKPKTSVSTPAEGPSSRSRVLALVLTLGAAADPLGTLGQVNSTTATFLEGSEAHAYAISADLAHRLAQCGPGSRREDQLPYRLHPPELSLAHRVLPLIQSDQTVRPPARRTLL